MNIFPIHTDEDLDKAFERVDQLWGASPGSPEAEELEILSILIEKYEDQHYPIPVSDPIEAIRFTMEQKGLSQRDLVRFIGGSGRVSEVLNGKRGLSIRMIKKLHNGLGIPYESLLDGIHA